MHFSNAVIDQLFLFAVDLLVEKTRTRLGTHNI